jgi:hypothetical protein
MLSTSVDRLNGRLGYVKGNVRLVCVAANLARNEWSDEDLIKLCEAIVEHAKSKTDETSNTSAGPVDGSS